MTQINDLQDRITRALDRIARGVDGWEPGSGSETMSEPQAASFDSAFEADVAVQPAPVEDSAEVERLREALEDEKLANAQMEERIRVLHARLEEGGGDTAGLKEQLAAQRESLAHLDGELQRLRQANDQLKVSNEALRQANAQGVGEPHLINKAMLAELESIRAVRASEAAETRVVLDRLTPLLAAAAGDTDVEEGNVQ